LSQLNTQCCGLTIGYYGKQDTLGSLLGRPCNIVVIDRDDSAKEEGLDQRLTHKNSTKTITEKEIIYCLVR